MYDPNIGRWLQEDPEGFAAGDSNLNRYVGNDPTNRTDPSGLEGISDTRKRQLTIFEQMLNNPERAEALNQTYRIFPAGRATEIVNYTRSTADRGGNSGIEKRRDGTDYKYVIVNPDLLTVQFETEEARREEISRAGGLDAYDQKQALLRQEQARKEQRAQAERQKVWDSLSPAEQREWQRLPKHGLQTAEQPGLIGSVAQAAAYTGFEYQSALGLAYKDLSADERARVWQGYQQGQADQAAQGWLAAQMGADLSLFAEVKGEIKRRREEFEQKTPGLRKEQRKAVAPWLYGDERYFRPQLDYASGEWALSFTPTLALRKLQLLQALRFGVTVGSEAMTTYKSFGRAAPFDLAVTAPEAVAQYETFGRNDLESQVRFVFGNGLRQASGDFAMVIPVQALRGAVGGSIWRRLALAGAELTVGAAWTVAISEVAQRYGPAAGAALPFLPAILSVAARRPMRWAFSKELSRPNVHEHHGATGGRLIEAERRAAQAEGKALAKGPATLAPKKPTIHPGQQGKHIPGHNNFDPAAGRSGLTHPDPQTLLNKGAGTGTPLNKLTPGTAGSKEVVDFGEVIGIYYKNGVKVGPTTRGTIHYGAGGAHIVPAPPTPPIP
jgi:hypothetical protein